MTDPAMTDPADDQVYDMMIHLCNDSSMYDPMASMSTEATQASLISCNFSISINCSKVIELVISFMLMILMIIKFIF